MGRWAQRRLGSSSGTPLNYMVSAATTLSDFVTRVTYQHPIDASQLDPADFEKPPAGGTGTNANQIDPHTIDLTWTDVYEAGDSVAYTGSYPNLQSPQNKLITSP